MLSYVCASYQHTQWVQIVSDAPQVLLDGVVVLDGGVQLVLSGTTHHITAQHTPQPDRVKRRGAQR